jgi:hypothetical protein
MGSNVMQARRSVASLALDGQSGLNKTGKKKFLDYSRSSGGCHECLVTALAQLF